MVTFVAPVCYAVHVFCCHLDHVFLDRSLSFTHALSVNGSLYSLFLSLSVSLSLCMDLQQSNGLVKDCPRSMMRLHLTLLTHPLTDLPKVPVHHDGIHDLSRFILTIRCIRTGRVISMIIGHDIAVIILIHTSRVILVVTMDHPDQFIDCHYCGSPDGRFFVPVHLDAAIHLGGQDRSVLEDTPMPQHLWDAVVGKRRQVVHVL